VALGDPVVRALDAGVTVLPQLGWAERERLLYARLYAKAIRVNRDGTLVLPHLVGSTLAALLADSSLGRPSRMNAIHLAAAALAAFHAKGFTHADAMAENVMVDLDAGVARWFDFETVHDPDRDATWCRADDVRALVSTCLLRAPRAGFAETVDCTLRGYGDTAVLPHVARSFASTTHRALPFHLGQAPLSYDDFHHIGQLLDHRLAERRARA
jgi:hypothetical protein